MPNDTQKLLATYRKKRLEGGYGSVERSQGFVRSWTRSNLDKASEIADDLRKNTSELSGCVDLPPSSLIRIAAIIENVIEFN